MYDALGVLQTLQTAATAVTGPAYDLLVGAPRHGLKVRFLATSIAAATAGAVWTPVVEESADGTAWKTHSVGSPVTAGTAAQASEQFLPVETSNRYIRSKPTLSPTTGTPAISYQAEVGIARP